MQPSTRPLTFCFPHAKAATMLRISLVHALVAAASAAILVSDDFSTNGNPIVGNLVGTTPDTGLAWAAHSAAGTNAVVASSGAISI